MHFGINKLIFFFCFLLGSVKLYAQPIVSLTGPSQARIGMGTSAVVRVINNSIHGPARASIHIPKDWILELYPGELASVSQSGNQIKIIWLEFPIRDTVEVAFLLKIPENENKGTHSINGTFDYVKDGNIKSVSIPQHSYKVFKYYTRVQ